MTLQAVKSKLLPVGHRENDQGVKRALLPSKAFIRSAKRLTTRNPVCVADLEVVLELLAEISIANGSHGYLPTPEQQKLGGYETWIGINHVQFDASVKMVNALVEILGELAAKKP